MKQFVKDCDNLLLNLYIIGYPDKGESQVILIIDRTDNVVLFSGVVDCYSYKNINKTTEILKSHNVTRLDFFCWTHTDDDHSVGTSDIVNNFCDKTTSFYLPEGIYGDAKDYTSYSTHIQTSIDEINALNKNRAYNVSTISVPSQSSLHIDKLTRHFKDGLLKEIEFKLLALAPNGAIIRRRITHGLNVKNDTSIALLLRFGDFSIFLSGDIENITIQHILPYHFEGLTYLKTPHHTSKSSDKLLEKFDEVFNGHKILAACSTVYGAYNLPDLDLVDDYQKYAETFISTGDSTGGHLFGVIKIEYDPSTLSTKEEIEGNSTMLF